MPMLQSVNIVTIASGSVEEAEQSVLDPFLNNEILGVDVSSAQIMLLCVRLFLVVSEVAAGDREVYFQYNLIS